MYRPALVMLLAACITSFAHGSDAGPAGKLDSRIGAGEKADRFELLNVELSPQGTLQGRVLDAAGKSLTGVTVGVRIQSAQNKSAVPALAKTDADGRFSFAISHGSVCVLQTGEWLYPIRTWRHGTAPPKSVKDVALVVSDKPIVRGQSNRVRRMSTGQKYGVAAAALGGVAAYMALSRDNVSE
ncbi:Ig-like domain-containing protein [Fuerstiella marisgermanici]|uniref:Carboxypeptidase regulatory-like domain-containing protein n=1 Tax=Fuerstiella marisgermanici TaxID=1891926 RepID=A0A1P8WDD2_9PLAN|nr:Ig-like domain-containing protein [Fuerstiella marisgermanici]APZ92085.1 hypothetical protein Fuma_01689 [Fuerstiella marisgermanici]